MYACKAGTDGSMEGLLAIAAAAASASEVHPLKSDAERVEPLGPERKIRNEMTGGIIDINAYQLQQEDGRA